MEKQAERQEVKQAERIQTSILNAAEKKALVFLAERQPKWMTSNILSGIGFVGSLMIALGYILTNKDIAYIWLASLGFIINWYGDSLDGTLARVRKTQRPVYGYYLDHTLDCVNECFMFLGAGLSCLMEFKIAALLLIAYLLMTLNVSMDAHLKKEFKLTYAKLGPTEFRIIVIIVNTLFYFIEPLRKFRLILGRYDFSAMDIVAAVILIMLSLMYVTTVLKDLDYYAKVDPPKKAE